MCNTFLDPSKNCAIRETILISNNKQILLRPNLCENSSYLKSNPFN